MRDMQKFTGLLVRSAAVILAPLFALSVNAAVPGITGPVFDLVAAPGYISQPDGQSVYAWGYGCYTAPTGFAPAAMQPAQGANCPALQMQLPGPTLIVNQNDIVTVTLHNNLPAAAGNTSILFPGFSVSGTGATGVLTSEATPSGTATYTFTATTPGTHTYYSGTQGDLQIEMGLYGVLIVLPTGSAGTPTGYTPATGTADTCFALGANEFRLAAIAYNNPQACYDREYLFQFSEMDPVIHRQAEEQVLAGAATLNVVTEPYKPAYYLINGRSFPDDADPAYALQYPRQPYNGNPHMHPGELTLLRVVGSGREQHPFHEHGNHVRVLARDGNLLLSQTAASTSLAGPLLFTTTTTPGLALDGIFDWTAKGLNWDASGHTAATDADEPCHPDANGYYTSASTPAAVRGVTTNYYEWCADHKSPLEAHPFGTVGAGGPVTLPDPNIFANGPWYAGSPYLGPDATAPAVGATPVPPSGTIANDPGTEAGFAFMWHSHNEREITTNNIFPGGMMMMMLVDPWVYPINEAN